MEALIGRKRARGSGSSRDASKFKVDGDGSDYLDRLALTESRFVLPLFDRIHDRSVGQLGQCRPSGYNLEFSVRTLPPDGGFRNQRSINSKLECTRWKLGLHAVEEFPPLFHFTHANRFRGAFRVATHNQIRRRRLTGKSGGWIGTRQPCR